MALLLLAPAAFLAACGTTSERRITIDPATVNQAKTPDTLLEPCEDLEALPAEPPDVYGAVSFLIRDRAQYRNCAAEKQALIDVIAVQEGRQDRPSN
ncbi:hypothetical protein [uncultured Martelella sp.]|uniref:hypothetical protein n=1 Tax=uncultured Martelella sp. TaxID=392331 RepID=UPI0029C89BD4|nr:hypothetical protein [uncultured Martelella sp.]